MKAAVVLASTLAVASAFAPAPVSRVSTELKAAKKEEPEKKPLFSTIFGMDLFAPNPDVNSYGARAKKNVSLALFLMFLAFASNSWILPFFCTAQDWHDHRQVLHPQWTYQGPVREDPGGRSGQEECQLPEECCQGRQVRRLHRMVQEAWN